MGAEVEMQLKLPGGKIRTWMFKRQSIKPNQKEKRETKVVAKLNERALWRGAQRED